MALEQFKTDTFWLLIYFINNYDVTPRWAKSQ